jgi:ABC-type phosphate transport system substrate-binding protein
MGAASAAALACLSTVSHAQQTAIYGGGSTLAQFDYISEQTYFNANSGLAQTFSTYWETGSGTGQQSFIADDLCDDVNKVNGGNNCTANAGAAGNTVDYGASDAVLSASQISSWATASFGQSAAGNLIQLPSMGVGISIPVVDTNVTKNGALHLSDNDLCGIFSGLITNFSQITDGSIKPTAGPIEVVYRSDGSGTTFLLTSHLAGAAAPNTVCTTSNTATGITFSATTSFASLFPSGVPSNFQQESGSGGIANYMNGCDGGTAYKQSIAYLSPDFTTIDPSSSATIGCGTGKSKLVVASVAGSTETGNYTPTNTNIETGLTNPVPGTGANLTPPSGSAANVANPALWVPVEPVVTSGYAIVGYTTFDIAQCYATKAIGTAVQKFLDDHYTNASYTKYQSINGFVSLSLSHASGFLADIQSNIFANANSYNTNIDNATACKGKAGR